MSNLQNTTRFDGVIMEWNDDRGFGFIEPSLGGQRVFLHIKAIERRTGRPSLGQALTFEVDLNQDGKKQAKNVQLIQPSQPSRNRNNANRNNSPARRGTAGLFAIPAFIFVYVLVDTIWKVPDWVAGVYLLASIVTFIYYAVDKSAAVAGRWRVEESSLIFLGLLCGWPGGLIAQQVLRHKSNKAQFLAPFWVTVVINILIFVAVFSPYGAILYTYLRQH